MHPCLLTDAKQAKKKIKVSGVGGVQLIVNKVGFLDGFFLKCIPVLKQKPTS
jgi:hypothetical protein